MTIFAPFLSGFLISAALVLAIGAQNLFVLRQGLRGEHVGMIILFCGSADALLIGAGVGGVGIFLAAIPQLAHLLSLFGVIFLGWYGVKALRRTASPQAMQADTAGAISLGRALTTTAAFTFLNPHVYLDTVLLIGTAGAAQPAGLRPIFVAGAACASFSWFTALGYGARLLQPLFARPGAWRVLDALVGLTMLGLALALLMPLLPPL